MHIGQLNWLIVIGFNSNYKENQKCISVIVTIYYICYDKQHLLPDNHKCKGKSCDHLSLVLPCTVDTKNKNINLCKF